MMSFPPFECILQEEASIYDGRSGLGRGSPKSKQKEQNQLIYGRGVVKKTENFADIIYGSPQKGRASLLMGTWAEIGRLQGRNFREP